MPALTPAHTRPRTQPKWATTAVRRLAEEIDEIRVRGLRDAIAHQQEIVDRCGKVSTEVAKLVMIQQQRLGENHDQLANAKLLAEIQQRRLTESQDRLARLRQDLAALFSELVEKRSCGGGGHTRASPAFVPH